MPPDLALAANETDWDRVYAPPAGRALGLHTTERAVDHCVMRGDLVPAASEPGAPIVDRGAIAALADQCMGSAASGSRPRPLVTLDLRMDWLTRPLPDRPVFARAEVTARVGRTVLVSAKIDQGEGTLPVARGTAQFLLGAYAGGYVDRKGERPAFDIESSAPDFAAYLGLDRKRQTMHFTPQGWHVGSPFLPALHGGITAAVLTATLVDRMARIAKEPYRLLTSSTQFLVAGNASEPATIAAQTIRLGKSVVLLHAVARQRQRFALAQAVFVASSVHDLPGPEVS